MALRKPTGNMYSFITGIWNPVRGKCGYGCRYCYTKRWGAQLQIHLDERELRKDLGAGNFIFVCSGCDLFHPNVPDKWIERLAYHSRLYPNNKYLLHTKNPGRVLELAQHRLSWGGEVTACVTVESNRWFEDMGNAPKPEARFSALSQIEDRKMITIEPVMDFDVDEFSKKIIACSPLQVNIGADSGRNGLQEPSKEKVIDLIAALSPLTIVHLKQNLRRLLPEHGLYGRKCV